MTTGEKIKKLRKELRLTQDDLAMSTKTTKQTIHKYETGIISNIPASKISALAKRLGTTPAYLMGWSDDEKNNSISPELLPCEEETDERLTEPLTAEAVLSAQIAEKKRELQKKLKSANLSMDQLIKIEYLLNSVINN